MPARVRFFGSGSGSGPTPPPYPYTPPLDAYSSTVVAYSVRKLSSSYNGPCLQVRRASDSTTLDIGFDGNGLVNTSDIAAFCSGSIGTVSVWYDQGTLGQNATATTSLEPEIYSGTAFHYVNDIPALRANGINVRFDDVVAHTGDWCNLFVMSSNSASNPYPTSYVIGPTSAGSVFGSDANSFMLSSAGNVTIRGYGNIQSIHAIFSNASRLQYARNAVGGVTAGGLSGRTYDSFLLRRASDDASMDMQEWIMWDSDLITSQIALETNLNNYYQVSNLPYYTSGFLTTFPDSAAAYSVRKLNNTAIKCLRVRRTVAPYDEKDIGFDSNGDLDTASISSFGGTDSLRVSRWYDQSGQSRHAVQPLVSNQPVIYDGTVVYTVNGKGAISFNGVNEYLLSSAWDGSTIDNLSHSRVYSTETNAVADFAGTIWSFGDSANAGRYTLSNASTALLSGEYVAWSWADSPTFNHRLGSTTYRRAGSFQFNEFENWLSTGFSFYQNGVAQTIDLNTAGWSTSSVCSPSITTSNRLGIGCLAQPTPGVFQKMRVQELIFWDANKSGNRIAIETNTNGYYGMNPNGDAATSGFLFDYSGATFAYSIRQLNNNADYCMQVIRADGATLSIGFDGSGYVDTAAIVSFAGGQKVYLSRMYDQTGNRYHSSQVSIVAGTPKLVVVYDGTSLITKNGQLMPQMDLSSAASTSNIISPTGTALGLTHSLYAVVQRPSAPNALNMFSTTNTGVTALYQERGGNLTYGPGWTNYGIYTYPSVSNQPRLYSYIRKNGTDGECFNDGVSQGTTNLMNASIQVNISGYRFDKSSLVIQADCSGFQEMIAYSDDRTAVGDNANILANIKGYYPSIP